jgi:hypothetical protein
VYLIKVKEKIICDCNVISLYKLGFSSISNFIYGHDFLAKSVISSSGLAEEVFLSGKVDLY